MSGIVVLRFSMSVVLMQHKSVLIVPSSDSKVFATIVCQNLHERWPVQRLRRVSEGCITHCHRPPRMSDVAVLRFSMPVVLMQHKTASIVPSSDSKVFATIVCQKLYQCWTVQRRHKVALLNAIGHCICSVLLFSGLPCQLS